MKLDETRLVYVFSLRTSLASNEIDNVYVYQVDGSFQPVFNDGEVAETQWFRLDVLKSVLRDPEGAHIVDQGEGYFLLLLDALERAIIEDQTEFS